MRTGGLASHWHWTGAVEENQDVYATVTSRPLAAMPGQPTSPAVGGAALPAQPLAVLLDVGGATTGRGALELLEPVRPRGLTTKRVQVKGGGAGARATAAYYLPTDLPTCLPTYLPTHRPTDRPTD